jgi:uncharacterized membrane protein
MGLAGLIAGTGGLAQDSSPSTPSVRASAAEVNQSDSAAVRFFETKVRPVLAEHCFKCHGADKQKAGLRLDSREAVLKGASRDLLWLRGIRKAAC